jgi:homospermidine synthase
MTALVTHGANPGLVSHLVKHALLDVAAAKGHTLRGGNEPATREQWAALAQGIGRSKRSTSRSGTTSSVSSPSSRASS